MEATHHYFYNGFDSWEDDLDLADISRPEDMPWREFNTLMGIFVSDGSTQPPAETKSPTKSSPLQSSPSADGDHAQFTPSSTNPDFSNESSFEVDDGSYGGSSVYTTSPAEDYVHVESFSSRAAGPSTVAQPPPSTSGGWSSLAHRPREFSATPFVTAPYQQWPSGVTSAAMDHRNPVHQQAFQNYGFGESAGGRHHELMENLPGTGAYRPPFRPTYCDNPWPVNDAHPIYPVYPTPGHQFLGSWAPPQPPSQPFSFQPPLAVTGGALQPNREPQYHDQTAFRPTEQEMHDYWLRSGVQHQQPDIVYPQQFATNYLQPPSLVPITPPEPDLLHPSHGVTRGRTPSHAQISTSSSSRQRELISAGPATGNDGRVPKKDKIRVGGRHKGTPLHPQTRQKSSAMRRTGACWRCAMQRDQCDGNDPCSRCEMRVQKGQQYFFACDRSKLPDFVLDFLPPSMTLMHQKQTIEDCVQEQVRSWDFGCPVDVYLTSGYGHALRWTLYEFEPTSQELLNQFQYFQDPSTGLTMRCEKYSPPLGITKLDPSDDTHFSEYLDTLMAENYLQDFGWTCFEEENLVNEFQSVMLALLCRLSMQPGIDYDLRELLRKIIRMMVITYIMGHTLTIVEDTLPSVLNTLKRSHKPLQLAQHTSPRLANRQLKFFFHVLREAIYAEILKWLQATLHTSGSKDSSWLPAFCVMLGFGMVLEEVQRTIQIQADSKAQKGEKTEDEARQEALNACGRIDERYTFLIGLFQCKYRDRKWTSTGSFGNSTPVLKDATEREFLKDMYDLLVAEKLHLRSREHVTFSSENQCKYTSRLVARFLLPFLGLPAQ